MIVPNSQLAPVDRAAIALGASKHEQRLLMLAKSAGEIVAIANKAGYEQCHAQRVSLKFARVDIEKLGKAAREDATKFSKAVIAEERRLIGIIEPEETRLKALQDDWEAAQAAERAEAERVEVVRRDGIKALIVQRFTGVPTALLTASASAVQEALNAMNAQAIDADDYQDMTFDAENAKTLAVTQLNSIYTSAVDRERAEADRLARAEADRIKAEAAAAEARAEAERLRERLKAERDQRAVEDAARRAKEEADAALALSAQVELAADRKRQEELSAANAKSAKDALDAAEARIKKMEEDQEAERVPPVVASETLEPEKLALEWVNQPNEAAQELVIPAIDAEEEAALVELEPAPAAALFVRPSDAEIIAVLAAAFDADESAVTAWLRDMNLNKTKEAS